MSTRVIGPPPGWAGEGYGAQWSASGFRAWIICARTVIWLDWHQEVTVAMAQAEEWYDATRDR